MNLGVCTISAKSRSVESILKTCGSLPVDGVEIWGRDHVGDGSGRCQEISSAASEHELSIPVYGSYLRLGTDEFHDVLDRELNIADVLGADMIRVWAGADEFQECSEKHWSNVVSHLEQLATSAEKMDLSVTVERHAGTVTNKTEGAKRLIESVETQNVGLNWQPLFEHGAGVVADDINALAHLVNNVHLQAVPGPNCDKRCALSDAYFDIEAIIETLAANAFEGYLEVEFVTDSAPYHAALASDVAFVRSLL